VTPPSPPSGSLLVRKLQSLRRELGKARVLLQLVVERELMKQSQLDLQSRIFENRLAAARDESESEEEGDGDEEAKEVEDSAEKEEKENGEEKEETYSQYRYRPRFEHLMPVASKDQESPLPLPFFEEKERGGGEASGLRITLSMKSHSLNSEGLKKREFPSPPRRLSPTPTPPHSPQKAADPARGNPLQSSTELRVISPPPPLLLCPLLVQDSVGLMATPLLSSRGSCPACLPPPGPTSWSRCSLASRCAEPTSLPLR
jgi:hypothetical protein